MPNKQIHRPFLLAALTFMLVGCGYSAKSALPPSLRTVHVEAFKNKIAYTSESVRNIYFPLLEVDVRNAVINRFLFDGNLKIADPDQADLVLQGELVAYQRHPLRYTDNDDVLEYRVQIIVNLVMKDQKNGGNFWEESGFGGEADYFVSGAQAGTEENAVKKAVVDLARRIVERTIENW